MNTRYVCPLTLAPLERARDELVGPAGQRYPIDRGLPLFLSGAPVEEPELVAQLDRLVARAREVGWRRAVQAEWADPRYVTSEGRAAYVDLLPLDSSSRVLEVGCSLGQGTAALARRAGSVDAVEVVPGQAAFAAERLRQDGLDNVDVCVAGDDCRLPFASDRFDVAVLNLVVEWCGARGSIGAAGSQRRLLSEVARTLKRNGTVFVATKNRFGLPYLTGAPDEHSSDLRFASLLPRALLPAALRVAGKPPAAGNLHSYPALTRLLRAAGFTNLRPYWAAPDARYPARYIPADRDSILAAKLALSPGELGRTRRVRWLMKLVPAGLLRYVAPSLVFLAAKA